MYERLTVAYGTLCRETTPLLMNWDPEDERNPTPNDVIMTELFARLQPAFDEFCKSLGRALSPFPLCSWS